MIRKQRLYFETSLDGKSEILNVINPSKCFVYKHFCGLQLLHENHRFKLRKKPIWYPKSSENHGKLDTKSTSDKVACKSVTKTPKSHSKVDFGILLGPQIPRIDDKIWYVFASKGAPKWLLNALGRLLGGSGRLVAALWSFFGSSSALPRHSWKHFSVQRCLGHRFW